MVLDWYVDIGASWSICQLFCTSFVSCFIILYAVDYQSGYVAHVYLAIS